MLVGGRVAHVGGRVAHVGGPVTLVCRPVAFLGQALTFLGQALTLVGKAFTLVSEAITFVGIGFASVGMGFALVGVPVALVDDSLVFLGIDGSQFGESTVGLGGETPILGFERPVDLGPVRCGAVGPQVRLTTFRQTGRAAPLGLSALPRRLRTQPRGKRTLLGGSLAQILRGLLLGHFGSN
ncbi:hypothetical protein F4554_005894 [Actinopolymorpha rutila]|uniref:Uncharacterized protein n=1 Tax=Actinopolymorpha rutila TaxID=446787 RepID=A0A852ZX11_9ACTN|nr:hypothetical protein [Actinopolymorpha rutila]NYH93256.1 hypothetical protein [Actinopolymorpha rutila]